MNNLRTVLPSLLALGLLIAIPSAAAPPDVDLSWGPMRALMEHYRTDQRSLARFHSAPYSPRRAERFREFYREWQGNLASTDFDRLDQDGKVDYLLLRYQLESSLRDLDLRAKALSETAELLPFGAAITDMEDARRRMEPLDPARAAGQLDRLTQQVQETRRALERPGAAGKVKREIAFRAVDEAESLRGTLRNWYGFYNGYDPIFTWWAEAPFKSLDAALFQYAGFLREKVVGLRPDDKTTIIGNPIGREALISELQSELIPYTPEELMEIARKEFAWCEAEMKRAASDMGFSDWREALEAVKKKHVEPGKQPDLIRKLALEAIEFVEKRDLVTVPQLAKDTWRMEMMSPERQLVSPFFTGGETISIAFPTAGMTHEQKMMSMRGNNIHFSRATVQHELIPGHHLQGFMAQRYRTHRQSFGTPFVVEGWALYWEMLLWDLGFPQTPEDRIGMLFWRSHRCARIVFSLGFHLGKMSPQECIDMLVERVGHERDNATAEVRRSFNGTYPPLYQAAYMLGGLQIRALHQELVASGKMTNRAFHDAVLKQNSIPVELIRASLTNQQLTREFKSTWRFYPKE